MKKVAIITIWDMWNLGNRLQNYAVVKIFRDKGVDPVTVAYKTQKRNKIIDSLDIYIKKLIFMCSNYKKGMSGGRVANFRKFTNRYIPFECINDLSELKKYDYVAIGSDQIWNANLVEADEFSYGVFFDAERVICVSPSFGVEKFDAQVEAKIAHYLNKLKYISVRETAGKEMIQRLTGKTVPVLLDPTLMIDADDWSKLEKKPVIGLSESKYILKYFLGEEAPESASETEELVKKYGFKVVKLIDPRNPKAFSVGPAEFIYLIHNAEMILTDSFHACVFSILFKKPFWVYNRVGAHMNSRLETLFELLNIENRFVHNMENPFAINYENVEKRLENERSMFDKYITCAIRGVSNNEV